MDDSKRSNDAEVERLRKLVKDLETQNTALRSQKTPESHRQSSGQNLITDSNSVWLVLFETFMA